MKVKELANELGITHCAVWYWIKKLGLHNHYTLSEERTVNLTDEDAKLIKESCIKYQTEQGKLTVSYIVGETGVSKQTVWNIINEMGIDTGSRKDAMFAMDTETADKIIAEAKARKLRYNLRHHK